MSKEKSDFYTVANFREFIEAIEIARDFLMSNTPQKVRLALITLDNTAEVIMWNICREIFDQDEFDSKIVRPRFSPKAKKNTLQYFEPKVKLMKAEDVIGETEAALLKIGHSYRNPAYHMWHHNTRSARMIAVLLLKPLSTLLKQAFSGVYLGGFSDDGWLGEYGIQTSPFCFSDAADKITAQIINVLSQLTSEAREVLYDDITIRTKALEEMRRGSLYSMTAEEWDDVLTQAEFARSFDEDSAAAEYRSAVYKMTDRLQGIDWDKVSSIPPSDPASVQHLARCEAEYKENRTKAFRAFLPTIRTSHLAQFHTAAEELRQAQSESALVLAYRDIDERLSSIEDLFLSARSILEASIQHAIDLDRGK